MALHDCYTLTSTANFCFLARHPASCSTALPKVFSRRLQVYQCIRTRKSQQESMWVAKSGTTSVHVDIAIATEVIQLPCSGQQAFLINVYVWLVTLTDESEASIGNLLYLCLLL